MAEGGTLNGVYTHDEEGDEDHTQAGEKQKAASVPFVGKSCQDLPGEKIQVTGCYHSGCGVAWFHYRRVMQLTNRQDRQTDGQTDKRGDKRTC